MTTERWELDLSHSSINFTARHMMVSKVHGRFAKWTGTLEWNFEAPQNSRIDVRVETASIDTQEPKRDAHLRSADFFDADNHPLMTFKSTRVERAGERFKATGDLTIRGTTRPVTLDIEFLGRGKDPWGGERVGFSATASLNRRDFGLNWNVALEAGGILVSDKIDISLEVEAVSTRPQPEVEAAPRAVTGLA